MRTLVLMLALLWGAASWWWYTCDIKGYCNVYTFQAKSNKEQSIEYVAITEKITEKTDKKADDADEKNKPDDVIADTTSNSNKTTDTSKVEPAIEVKTDEETSDDTESDQTDSDADVAVVDDAERDEITENTSDEATDEIKETPDETATETEMPEETAENDTADASSDTSNPELADATVANDTAEESDATNDTDAETQADATETGDAPVAVVEEEIASPDDNDLKKIRIDKVADSTTNNIQKARIYFPYNSSKKADLTGSATRYFDQIIAALKADESLKIQLTGHTDSEGQARRNQTLGLRRAETVKSIFVEKGVKASQIITDSKGEDKPIATNKSEAGRNKNRRVTVEAVTTTTASE